MCALLPVPKTAPPIFPTRQWADRLEIVVKYMVSYMPDHIYPIPVGSERHWHR